MMPQQHQKISSSSRERWWWLLLLYRRSLFWLIVGWALGAIQMFVWLRTTTTPEHLTAGARGPAADGWHAVDVFTGGATKYLEHLIDATYPLSKSMNGETVGWYAQALQDKLVVGLTKYKRNGYYIDLAANDNHDLSNTYTLDRFYQWKGLCIEANPRYWLDLARSRTCGVVGAAVGGSSRGNDPVMFHLDNEMGGIVGGDGFKNQQNKNNAKTTTTTTTTTAMLYTVPIAEILQRFNAPNVIDYMSLDVEGAESFVMMSFPFDTYRIKILSIEGIKEDLRQLLLKNKYIYIKDVIIDSWWIHSDFEHELNIKAFDDYT